LFRISLNKNKADRQGRGGRKTQQKNPVLGRQKNPEKGAAEKPSGKTFFLYLKVILLFHFFFFLSL